MNPDRRIRAVLDTGVLVAGVISASGASREILRLAWQGRFDWLTSVTLIFDYEAALKKPKNLRAAGLPAEEVDNLLDAICHLISPVVYGVVRPRRPFSPDPGDDHVIEVAVQGCADWLVTLNEADFGAVAGLGIRVGRPGRFLTMLREGSVQ